VRRRTKQTLRSVRQTNVAVIGTKTVLMIVKKKNTYEVRSKKGKLLGKFLTKKAAAKRLAQIEFFKSKSK
jgi:hypothetical protein